MKISLINPVSSKKGAVSVGIPTGLFTIASFLKNEGHEIQLIDAPILNISQEEIVDIVLQFYPDIVGFGPMSAQFQNSLEISRKIKNKIPETKIIFGGPHVSFTIEESLKEGKIIDFIVAGEGEISFSNLIKLLENGEEINVKGVSYIKNGIFVNGGLSEIPSLKDYPSLDLSMLPMKLYQKKDEGEFGPTFSAVRIMTGRGCPSNCNFCIVHKINPGNVRNYPVKRVMEQLRTIYQSGIRYIKFADDSFSTHKEFIRKIIYEMKREKIDLKFEIETRLDLLDRKLLIELKEVGLEGVWFGIESFDEKIRKNISKGISLKNIENGISMLHELNIRSSAFFMTGLPYQSFQSVINDAESASNFDLDLAVFSILTPFPGTEFGDNPQKYGIKIVDNNYENWTEMIPVIETSHMTQEEIGNATTEGYKRFFLNDNYLNRNIDFRKKMQFFVKNVILK